jgi:predicted nucleic-acid-binding protein
MKLIADTNVLLRALVADDAEQSALALEAMASAQTVAVSVHALCELVWVLLGRYNTPRDDVIAAIRQLLNTEKILLNRPAVEAGLALMAAGGDFADAVIAHEGRWLGGETFVSFDRKAVKLLTNAGMSARSLGPNS